MAVTKLGDAHAEEIRSGRRFEFGKNWSRFLRVLNEKRIEIAVDSLRDMLAVDDLAGKTFLDAGSGSGLFSLSARRLSACVHSFDYDPASVACTEELRRRYDDGSGEWTVERGSVLDADYLRSLGQFDVVYSWGVLHHTGDMWRAIDNVSKLAVPGGRLFISIYNDQGIRSRVWRRIKRFYCAGPIQRWLVIGTFVPVFVVYGFIRDVLAGRNPIDRFTNYQSSRGMSIVYDWFDWLGGYPFEVATPDRIVSFLESKGYELTKLKTAKSLGTNQFVFTRLG